MRIKLLFSIICCLLFAVSVFAQKQNVYFLKNDGKQVTVRDSADYIRILSEPDSGTTLYNVKEYYKNGKLKLIGKSSKIDYNLLEGQCVTYYQSGIKKRIANYKKSLLDGDIYDFYPNGKLHAYRKFTAQEINQPAVYSIIACNDSTGKVLADDGNGHYIWYGSNFKGVVEEGDIKAGLKDGKWTGNNDNEKDLVTFEEDYNNGKLISGKSFSQKDNQSYTYTVQEIMPQYPGGIGKFYDFLAQTVKYPANARRNNVQGTVMTSFVVKTDGSLADIKNVKNPDDELSSETLRVIKLSPKWIPGNYYGRPVDIHYTVPTKFTLGNP